MPSIVIRHKDGTTSVVQAQPFLYEDLLERTIARTPELLPFDAISDEAGRYVTLGRQWQAGTGIADIVLLASDGVLTVVETKLKRNPEARREVVAQVLEYAAYLSEWTTYDLARHTETYYATAEVNDPLKDCSFDTLLTTLIVDPEQTIDDFKSLVEQNLRLGKMRLVIGVDEVGEQAQKIVTFLNSTSSFDIFLLQISSYPNDGDEIFVPALYGYARKTRVPTPSKTWTWEQYVGEGGWTNEQVAEAQELTDRLMSIAEDWNPEVRLHNGWIGIRCSGKEQFGIAVSKRHGVELYFTTQQGLEFPLPVGITTRRSRVNMYLSGELNLLTGENIRSQAMRAFEESGVFLSPISEIEGSR